MVQLFALLVFGPVFTADWQIDRPGLEIVDGLVAKISRGPGLQLMPPDVARALELVDGHIRIDAYPARHIYVFFAEALQVPSKPVLRRIRHANVTVEVTAIGSVTRIHAKLDVSWGRDGCVSNWYLREHIAPRVFAWARQKIAEAGR